MKPAGSFKGGNESPHRIFPAALTREPTAPELHRGEPKVLSVHSIRDLNSTPLYIAIAKATSFQVRKPGFHDLRGHSRAPARRLYVRSKYPEKQSVILVRNKDFCEGVALASLRLVLHIQQLQSIYTIVDGFPDQALCSWIFRTSISQLEDFHQGDRNDSF